jgi:hypothetical protein
VVVRVRRLLVVGWFGGGRDEYVEESSDTKIGGASKGVVDSSEAS